MNAIELRTNRAVRHLRLDWKVTDVIMARAWAKIRLYNLIHSSNKCFLNLNLNTFQTLCAKCNGYKFLKDLVLDLEEIVMWIK